MSDAPRYRALPHRMAVEHSCAFLAELLLSDEPGATDQDVIELAEAFQGAWNDASRAIEGRQPLPKEDGS